jgi:catechol 2,3-dioxygenase-like lactoylglutathione lyase family enzyme
MLKCVSAITLATHDMARAVAFYEALDFELNGYPLHPSSEVRGLPRVDPMI